MYLSNICPKLILIVARQYYNCPTLDGIEVEDGGDPDGTVGSHWEKRILDNEYMTGTSSDRAQRTFFTLAFLQVHI